MTHLTFQEVYALCEKGENEKLGLYQMKPICKLNAVVMLSGRPHDHVWYMLWTQKVYGKLPVIRGLRLIDSNDGLCSLSFVDESDFRSNIHKEGSLVLDEAFNTDLTVYDILERGRLMLDTKEAV